MAVAVEIFAWSERNSGTKLAKALRKPGYEIQRLVGTKEPTAKQLEVGRAALQEILRVEGVGSRVSGAGSSDTRHQTPGP
jgi:uncharacterized protein YqhQ